MKFNPKSLKSFFNFIRQSPVDDIAVNAAKSNIDDLALGALDVADDIPQTHLLNSAIPFPEGTPDNPVDVDTFKDFYSKHRAENYAARNMFDGNPYDKSALTPGFGYDFGIPDRDGGFLYTGSAGISPRGHEVVVPPDFTNASYFADIDGKTFHLNGDYSELLGNEDLKTGLLNKHTWEALSGDVKDVVPYADGTVPYADRVTGVYGWRPHKNTALGKWFNKNKRMPKGISDEGMLDLDDLWANPDDLLPF